MKKIITSSFVLASVLAHAQEGKVGVNILAPKATLDVRMKSTNQDGTTNEGIIAPKLTKSRVAKIAASELTEGTLVYVEDIAYTPGADTAVEARIAKITEKGYYFYNGTEWVKAGADLASQIWQKQTGNKIQLVDSDIEHNVYYTPEGNYWNVPKNLRPVSRWNNISKTIVEESDIFSNSNMSNSANLNLQYADKVQETYLDPLYKEKQLSRNVFYIDANSNSSPIQRFFAQTNTVNTTSNATRNFESLYGAVNSASHLGTGKVDLLMGVYNLANLYNGSVNRIVGAYNQSTTFVSSHLPYMEGAYNYLSPRGSGTINEMYGTRNRLYLGQEESSNAINTVALSRNEARIDNNFTGTIDNLYGFSTYYVIPNTFTGVKNLYGVRISQLSSGQESNYGIKIENVGNSTATQNFAIHTGTGAVRLGDLKGTGNRPVFADADGKLIIGDATNAATSFKWVEDAANTSVKLAVTSAGTERTTAPVSITDTGMVKATSFQGSNGATIFPDYVFQKYYTGNSSIKADYTFKSLSQVEDFVKTNGHLPGYKSAAEIKNQGYIDLMETQLTNVEKIEELYLHTIELKKENEELKARLEKLEKLLK